jgi:hypothetical protein
MRLRVDWIQAIRESPKILLSSTPILWQSTLNYLNWGKFTPFPITDLGAMQIQDGIKNVKYATWVGPGSPSNFYPSESLVGEYDGTGLSWYLNNPIEAIQLVFFKFVGAFDFDYFYPYNSESNQYAFIVSTISFSLVLISLILIARHSLGLGNLSLLGPRWFPLLVFMSWAALTMLTMLELRFTLPILSFFLVICLASFSDFRSMRTPVKAFVLGLFLIGMIIFWTAAAHVRTLSVIG